MLASPRGQRWHLPRLIYGGLIPSHGNTKTKFRTKRLSLIARANCFNHLIHTFSHLDLTKRSDVSSSRLDVELPVDCHLFCGCAEVTRSRHFVRKATAWESGRRASSLLHLHSTSSVSVFHHIHLALYPIRPWIPFDSAGNEFKVEVQMAADVSFQRRLMISFIGLTLVITGNASFSDCDRPGFGR